MASERAVYYLGDLPEARLTAQKPYFRHRGEWVCVGQGGFATGATWQEAKAIWQRSITARANGVSQNQMAALYNAAYRPPAPIVPVRSSPRAEPRIDLARYAGRYGGYLPDPKPVIAAPYVEIKPAEAKSSYRTGEDLYAHIFPDDDWKQLPRSVRKLYDSWAST